MTIQDLCHGCHIQIALVPPRAVGRIWNREDFQVWAPLQQCQYHSHHKTFHATTKEELTNLEPWRPILSLENLTLTVATVMLATTPHTVRTDFQFFQLPWEVVQDLGQHKTSKVHVQLDALQKRVALNRLKEWSRDTVRPATMVILPLVRKVEFSKSWVPIDQLDHTARVVKPFGQSVLELNTSSFLVSLASVTVRKVHPLLDIRLAGLFFVGVITVVLCPRLVL
jgi:hypothetical protein